MIVIFCTRFQAKFIDPEVDCIVGEEDFSIVFIKLKLNLFAPHCLDHFCSLDGSVPILF